MRPILVTGGGGQLASALVALGGARVVRVGRPEFDLERLETIGAVFSRVGPGVVVNAAAWTAVDAAEGEPEAAMRANCFGPGELARLCGAAGVPMVHVSTDYVFDGLKGGAYVETDATCPGAVYGVTKLAGEAAVLAGAPMGVVLRTSWVYSTVGKNFVRTMLGAAAKVDRLRVVADQVGCPTSASHLAAAILAVMERIEEGWRPGYGGVFHAAGTGATSWHGLAEAVFEVSGPLGGRVPVVEAIGTLDWPTPARRPPDSRLDCGKLERVFGVRLPGWREGVAEVVGELMGVGRVTALPG